MPKCRQVQATFRTRSSACRSTLHRQAVKRLWSALLIASPLPAVGRKIRTRSVTDVQGFHTPRIRRFSTFALCRRSLAFAALCCTRRARKGQSLKLVPWTAQQVREALPWDEAPRYLIHDRDHAFD